MDAPAVLANVQGWIERRRPLFVGPGIQIGFTDRERTLGSLTLGFAEPGVPLTDDHLFSIASVSKSFTAILVMQEADAGRLRLDAPVSDLLPWFAPPTPFPPIRLHHLLSHTSGLVTGMDHTGDAVNELLQLAEQEPGFAPGERFWYSNAGYKALGLVAQEVTGRPWWELVRERILEPLGMDATEPVISNDVRSRMATGFVGPFDDRPWHSRHGLVPAPWFESWTADGTICSNAAEMCSYLRMLLASGGEVLSSEGYGRMTSPHALDPDDGVAYGYGLWTGERDGVTHVGHSGSLPGYRSFVMLDPEAGFGGVVLTNGGVGWEPRRELLAFALETLRASAAAMPLPEPPSPRTLGSVERPESFAGEYGDGALRLAVDDDRVMLTAAGVTAPLEAVGSDLFVAPHEGFDRFPLRVERRDGAIVGIAHGGAWFGVGDEGPPGGGTGVTGVEAAGRYRGYGIVPMSFTVVERPGSLWILDPIELTDDELVPLPDGSFRVGREPWCPGRVRFDSAMDDRVTGAIYDAMPLVRAFAT